MTVAVLPRDPRNLSFPPPEQATPEGLLAVGGDLSSARLMQAYRSGIFPWYSSGQPILWWSPDPRTVLYPADLHISRSLRRSLRRGGFHATLDRDFAAVIHACAGKRDNDPEAGTWITDEMMQAYCRLYELGVAHSVETWRDGELVGGLYGVALGRAFFGESMFSRVSDASKVALVYLVRQLERWGYSVIDCQLPTPHLFSLGAIQVPRARFLEQIGGTKDDLRRGRWTLDPDLVPL
jgi:leucyl/phenylalanyl-tRNA--protein transferase